MNDFKLEYIRSEAEHFFQRKELEEYAFFSGRKKDLNLACIYEYYKNLFSKKIVKEIGRFLSIANQTDRRRLQYLLEFLTINYKDSKIRKLMDQINTKAANATITLPTRESMSLHTAGIRRINEPNRELRGIIQQECEKVISGLNPLYKLIHKKNWQFATSLGYKNYISMIQYLSGINLTALCKLAQDFLSETETIYVSMLKKILTDEIGIDIKEAKSHDLGYITRGKAYDTFFPFGRIMHIVQRSIKDMGLDMTANGHIKLFDTKPRKHKYSRAFYVPVKIPDEIYVVIVPLGGLKNYGALLHELGHALQCGYTDKNLPFEYKRLGDASLSEGFASLFDHLIFDPDWLLKYLKINVPQKYLFDSSFWQLDLLRWFMGEFLYEFELRKSPDTTGKDELYTNIMYRACKVEFPKTMFLSAIDMDFFIARYIRAELFGALLWNYFENNIGKRWFESRSTGKFLKEIWKEGQKYTVDEIAAKLGYEKLDFKPYIDRIKKYII